MFYREVCFGYTAVLQGMILIISDLVRTFCKLVGITTIRRGYLIYDLPLEFESLMILWLLLHRFFSTSSHSFKSQTMLYLYLLSCLWAITLANTLHGHAHSRAHAEPYRVYHARRALTQGRAEEPDDITALGVQSATLPPDAPSNSGVGF